MAFKKNSLYRISLDKWETFYAYGRDIVALSPLIVEKAHFLRQAEVSGVVPERYRDTSGQVHICDHHGLAVVEVEQPEWWDATKEEAEAKVVEADKEHWAKVAEAASQHWARVRENEAKADAEREEREREQVVKALSSSRASWKIAAIATWWLVVSAAIVVLCVVV